MGRDSELSFIAGSGKAILKFSVGVSRWGKDNGTDWMNCVMFGDRCEKLAQYMVKGTKVIVEGSLKLDSYENKEGKKKYTTDIMVNNVEMIGNKKDKEPTGEQKSRGSEYTSNPDITPIDDGDIPF